MTRIRPSIRIALLVGSILLLLAVGARPETRALVAAPTISSTPSVVADPPTDTESPPGRRERPTPL